ncbi:hypothetical protein P152DRAFT_515303 [Eremomyces bilateralis CBS 781.70]|uniref:Uncharacterized protein n=1 Tax=Eremomyces bilateralis CBS 781.70 TaxID=1392243 RepID=A0A6G1G0L0_9PEZI|nr:uncharacterized protein P152DRAFT_515303 [Eremomyces bilateralis CBS 781.70]KAF1811349.1 hypothetical protein P152DRAFT_515303 [Eremomyces bilateralis CBS 781.70]
MTAMNRTGTRVGPEGEYWHYRGTRAGRKKKKHPAKLPSKRRSRSPEVKEESQSYRARLQQSFAPLAKPTDEERIRDAPLGLREHISSKGQKAVFCWVELTIPSLSVAKYQFPTCDGIIEERDYRIAEDPGRNIQTIAEWKQTLGRLGNRRDGAKILAGSPKFEDLAHKSGSASFIPKRIGWMKEHEFDTFSRQLAPIESDGPGERKKWNLFNEYLRPQVSDDEEDFKKPHSLSDMLCGKATACRSLNQRGVD